MMCRDVLLEIFSFIDNPLFIYSTVSLVCKNWYKILKCKEYQWFWKKYWETQWENKEKMLQTQKTFKNIDYKKQAINLFRFKRYTVCLLPNYMKEDLSPTQNYMIKRLTESFQQKMNDGEPKIVGFNIKIRQHGNTTMLISFIYCFVLCRARKLIDNLTHIYVIIPSKNQGIMFIDRLQDFLEEMKIRNERDIVPKKDKHISFLDRLPDLLEEMKIRNEREIIPKKDKRISFIDGLPDFLEEIKNRNEREIVYYRRSIINIWVNGINIIASSELPREYFVNSILLVDDFKHFKEEYQELIFNFYNSKWKDMNQFCVITNCKHFEEINWDHKMFL